MYALSLRGRLLLFGDESGDGDVGSAEVTLERRGTGVLNLRIGVVNPTLLLNGRELNSVTTYADAGFLHGALDTD